MNVSATVNVKQNQKGPAKEWGIFMVMVGVAILFEVLGRIIIGESFLFNTDRLIIIALQVSIIGIIAVGVNQVIIMGGIDLSGGSVVALTGMIAASFAQATDALEPLYPSLIGLPVIIPILIGLATGALVGFINGWITTAATIPPFITTLGMLVVARALATFYTEGTPIFDLSESFLTIGTGIWPIVIFLGVVVLFHVLLTRTSYGKHTYAIGSNERSAREVGININRHKVLVYTIAGLLTGLAGVVNCARNTIGQSGVGLMYELDAISAVAIGGTSILGGKGRITGTLIGVMILGIITSGFTFLQIDFYYQEIIKGIIIVAAVFSDQIRNKNKKK